MGRKKTAAVQVSDRQVTISGWDDSVAKVARKKALTGTGDTAQVTAPAHADLAPCSVSVSHLVKSWVTRTHETPGRLSAPEHR